MALLIGKLYFLKYICFVNSASILIFLFRPQELDSAARRRFVKRIYIPLPDLPARKTIISNLLKDQKHTLNSDDMEYICTLTEGFSGADMHSLCHDAALGPIRDIHDIELLSSEEVTNLSIIRIYV